MLFFDQSKYVVVVILILSGTSVLPSFPPCLPALAAPSSASLLLVTHSSAPGRIPRCARASFLPGFSLFWFRVEIIIYLPLLELSTISVSSSALFALSFLSSCTFGLVYPSRGRRVLLALLHQVSLPPSLSPSFNPFLLLSQCRKPTSHRPKTQQTAHANRQKQTHSITSSHIFMPE